MILTPWQPKQLRYVAEEDGAVLLLVDLLQKLLKPLKRLQTSFFLGVFGSARYVGIFCQLSLGIFSTWEGVMRKTTFVFLSCHLDILEYDNLTHTESEHLDKDLSLRFPP